MNSLRQRYLISVRFAQSFDDSFSNEHYVVYYFVLED